MAITIKNKLKDHDIRPTKIRIEVLNIFLESDHALSHSDLETQIGKKYDRVTLYRTLDILDKKGIIHKITDDLGITKYALCIDGSCIPNQHKCEHVHLNVCNVEIFIVLALITCHK